MIGNLILVVTVLWPLLVPAGGDHVGPIVVGNGPDKPAALHDLFNRPNRVHGYWINTSDTFFYDGDAAALTEFLRAYAAIEGVTHDVVLHVGPKLASSPWDEKPRDEVADWMLVTAAWTRGEGGVPLKADPYFAEVHVWLSRIPLEGLDVPASVTVRSAGEIEAFLEKRASDED